MLYRGYMARFAFIFGYVFRCCRGQRHYLVSQRSRVRVNTAGARVFVLLWLRRKLNPHTDYVSRMCQHGSRFGVQGSQDCRTKEEERIPISAKDELDFQFEVVVLIHTITLVVIHILLFYFILFSWIIIITSRDTRTNKVNE